MKITNKYSGAILLSALSIMMCCTSCNDDILDNSDSNNVRISSATVVPKTQSRVSLQGTNFTVDDKIRVTNSENPSKSADFTFDGKSWTTSQELSWGNSFPTSFYASYPAAEGVSYGNFTLPTDQSVNIDAANYMTAKADYSAKTSNDAIDLPFSHENAIVIINIVKQAVGSTGMLSNGKIYSPASSYANGTPVKAKTAIQPAFKLNDDGTSTYTAVIIPSGKVATHELFSVNVSNSSAPITFNSDINFKANHIYTFNVTIGSDRIVLSSLEVTDWVTKIVDGALIAGNWINYASKNISGSGTEADPFLIKSAQDLAFISTLKYDNSRLDKTLYIKLTNDINLSGKYWAPIAASDKVNQLSFNFDGGGHTISGMTIRHSDKYYAGLFGNIYESQIYNLNLKDVNIIDNVPIGAIAGIISTSMIYGCTVSGILSGNSDIGGLVGTTDSYLTIFACGTNCDITTNTGSAGGIIGRVSYSPIIIGSYAAGNVKAIGSGSIGTIIGMNTMSNGGELYSTASVQSGKLSGGTSPLGSNYESGVNAANLAAFMKKGSTLYLNKYIYKPQEIQWLDNSAAGSKACPLLLSAPISLTPFDFIPISTPSDLIDFATKINAGDYDNTKLTFRLIKDIDMTGVEWTVAAGVSAHPFKSTFDGGGHTISNINGSTGIFGVCYSDFIIKNITLKNVTISNSKIDCVIGYLANLISWGKIDNCHVTGNSSITSTYPDYTGISVGGLVGKSINTCNISRCSSSANVSLPNNKHGFCAGLVGDISNATIHASYCTGNVYQKEGDYPCGGLVGSIYRSDKNTDPISGCYFSGTINQGGLIFGRIGASSSAAPSTISYCASTAPNTYNLNLFNNQINSMTLNILQCNGANSNSNAVSEIGNVYGIVANSANTVSFTAPDGKTYNVKDCWKDNPGDLPTLKVNPDGTTN